MKIAIQREHLLKPLRVVMGVVDRVQARPILSQVLLRIADGRLSVTGTDSEIELTGYSDLFDHALHLDPVTIPGRKLLDICRTLPEHAVMTLTVEPNRVLVHSEGSRFMLATLPIDDFPRCVTQEGELIFSISQDALKAVLERTVFAIAQQDIRSYLNGLLFEIKKNQFNTVGTDAHRLAFSSTAMASDSLLTERRVIIPRKATFELIRLLERDDETVRVLIGTHYIHVIADDFSFNSKFLHGEYPDYRRVIPPPGHAVILLEKNLIKQALYRVAILCNEHDRSVRFEIQHNLLKMSAHNPEQEVSEEEIAILFTGPPIDIYFNVTYWLDVLNLVTGDNIKLTFVDSNTAVVIEEVNDPYRSIFVIMPIRI